MIHVMASSIIPASVASVWGVIRDFGALGSWLPGVKSCVIESDDPGDRVGAIRCLEMGDVGFIREQLLALSDVDHAVTFSIIESALPIQNYRSTISLLPITATNGTFIQWRGQFEAPAEHAASMEARMPTHIYQPAFDKLVAILASSPVPHTTVTAT